MSEESKKKRRPYALDYIVNAEPSERTNERTNEIHVELLLFCEFDVRAYVCWYQCQGEVRRKPKDEGIMCALSVV